MMSVTAQRSLTRGEAALHRLGRPSFAIWFPLAVYAISRLADALLIIIAARHQIALNAGTSGLAGYKIWEPSPASPGYASVASNWDGQWYYSIASHGYPTHLPRDAAGHALQNQWGFYPVYPLLVGAVSRVTGLGFLALAPTLSFLLGAAAVTVMFRLVSKGSGRFAAAATVLLVCAYMAAPAMQIAYTEGLALLLLCTALLLLRNRRYGLLVPVLVTLALTRAVVLAFVPVLVVHGIVRYRHHAVEPFSVPDRWRVAGLAGLAVAATGLWPAIAAVVTGDPGAYTQTMSSWGPTGRLRVLVQFPAVVYAEGGLLGLMVLLGIVALTAAAVLRRGARAWDPEVRAWAGFYPLYILLATAPGSSTVRHLFLAFPLMWAFPKVTATTAMRRTLWVFFVAVLAVVGLALQWLWISQFLVVTGAPRGRLYP